MCVHHISAAGECGSERSLKLGSGFRVRVRVRISVSVRVRVRVRVGVKVTHLEAHRDAS